MAMIDCESFVTFCTTIFGPGSKKIEQDQDAKGTCRPDESCWINYSTSVFCLTLYFLKVVSVVINSVLSFCLHLLAP